MADTFFAREDSNSAKNPALNLTNANAIQLTFVADGGSGDRILEANGGAVDPDTLVEIGGVSYNFVVEFVGTMPTAKSDGAQQVPDQYEGSDVIVITVQDYPTAGDTTRYAFLPNETATQAEMDAFGNGGIDVQALDENPPPTPVCFVRGTLIATPQGERPVETLRAGDVVLTASGGEAELQWVASSRFSYSQLRPSPGLRPVRIPRGYLGHRRPHSDLWVSPQHRIVLRGWEAELHAGADAVFIPAKYLVGEPGVPGMRWFEGVEYYHLLCDRHEILMANGLESESLYLGEEALKSLGAEALRSLEDRLSLDPALRDRVQRTILPTASKVEAQAMGFDKKVGSAA